MKQRCQALLLCLLLISSVLGSLSVHADGAEDEARQLIDGIIGYKCQDGDIQSLIDSELNEKAGIGAEWYIFSLAQYSKYDFSSYEKSLIEYLSKNEIHSAASRRKYALCLAAVGSENDYIASVMNEPLDSVGIMALIFNLHLLNNGYTSSQYTYSEVCDALLALQCDDGGWSVSGKVGDVDVTAMALQALSAVYEQSNVKIATDKALSFLSSAQQDSGGYKSYGVENPESSSQVLVALSSLNIDCTLDLRFIKNKNTLFDAIAKFRLSNGSFSHVLGGDANENATVQALYSMISYVRMKSGKTPLYILDGAKPSDNSKPPSTVTDSPASDTEKADITSSGKKKSNVKLIICLITFACTVSVCVLLFITKKNKPKNIIFVALVCVIVIAIVCLNDFSLPDDYYASNADTVQDPVGTITLEISCRTVVGKSDDEHIPNDGIILAETDIEFGEGETVYDVLMRAVRRHGIQADVRGGSESAYVSGINYLYEFDFGDLSGWVYHVNGVSPSVGCGQYKLSDGDKIEWLYTCDLGNDVGGDGEGG